MAPKVAKDIISYCTSCRMDLLHTIVAVHGDKVVRVLCGTCKKEHAFRLPMELRAHAAKGRAVKGPSSRKSRSTTESWESAMERKRGLTAKRYAMDGLYETGEKLDHSVFGLGMITKLTAPDKMEVLFEQGVKLLVRGNAR